MGTGSDDKNKINKKAWKPFAFLNSGKKRASILDHIEQANGVVHELPLRHNEIVGLEKTPSEDLLKS